jgi:Tfp pilus assembly protein PilN
MRAVNLIPVEQRSGQSVGVGRSQGGAYAVLVLVGGVALMAYLYGQASHQVTSRASQAASLTVQAQQTQAAAERLAPYTSFIALHEQRMQAVESLVDSRFDWAHVLHEFGRVLPAETSIASLSGTILSGSSTSTSSTSSSAGAAVASATPSGSVPTFTLSGCAISQPAVALTLERLHLIDGVNEVTLQSSTAGSAASAGGSSGGAGCSGRDASFNVTVSFDPLPSTSAVAAASKPSAVTAAATSASPKVSAK